VSKAFYSKHCLSLHSSGTQGSKVVSLT
jgi:hypothetical protein